jgi:hypothetical protein
MYADLTTPSPAYGRGGYGEIGQNLFTFVHMTFSSYSKIVDPKSKIQNNVTRCWITKPG